MNATPDHLDDEILSGLLDGEAGARGPGGVPPTMAARAAQDSDVAAHLRACDRCAGRQSELAAARTALAGAPVEPVDELTRRRLVAAALGVADEERASAVAEIPARARSRWASRHQALIGSAAAVVLALLVGVPFVVGNDGERDADSTLAAQAPSDLTQEAAGAYLGDLGDLSDRENLRLRLTSGHETFGYAGPIEPGASPAAGAPSPAPVASAAPMSGGLAGTTTAGRPSTVAGSRNSGGGTGSATAEKATSAPAADAATSSDPAQATDDAANRDRADTDACVAALLNGPAKGGRLTASGTGTFENRPAIVAVFDLSGGRVAFVADRAGCAVLDRFSV